MRKVVFACIGASVVIFVFFWFFFGKEGEKAVSPEELKNISMDILRKKMELVVTPDILIEEYPASAWILSQTDDRFSLEMDIATGYDFVLESAFLESPSEDKVKITVDKKTFDVLLPDRITTKVFYSLYTICPYEVSFFYNGKGKDLSYWSGVFKDIAPISGGTADGRSLYAIKDNIKIVFFVLGDKVISVEVDIKTKHKEEINSYKSSFLSSLTSLTGEKIICGDWTLRNQWHVPFSWVKNKTEFEEIEKIELSDFSWTVPAMLVKGEMVFWNGYFMEAKLYFTDGEWGEVSPVLSSWFVDIPKTVEFKTSRDGNIVEVSVADNLLKDIFLFSQRLNNSNVYDILRNAILKEQGE